MKYSVSIISNLLWFIETNSFKSNMKNVATLMVSRISEDTLELWKKVEVSFRLFCSEALYRKMWVSIRFWLMKSRMQRS